MLSVHIAGSLCLDAGAWTVEGKATILLPPAFSMFDQVADWLWQQSLPDPIRPGKGMIGIGAAALCLRWGTYLAVLLD